MNYFVGSIILHSLSRRMLRTASTFTKDSILKIAVLASDTDEACLTMLKHLPSNAVVISKGINSNELKAYSSDFSSCECLLVVSGTGPVLAQVLNDMPKLKWIHGIFAGLDHMKSTEFNSCSSSRGIVVTNAKGVFSSSLAEWVMGACWYRHKTLSLYLFLIHSLSFSFV